MVGRNREGGSVVPRRGSVAWMQFDGEGHEQQDQRPFVVVSEELFNRSGFAWISPVTGQVKGRPFEVAIPKGLCSIHGIILSDQIRVIDWVARKIYFSDGDCVPQNIMDAVSGIQASIIGR